MLTQLTALCTVSTVNSVHISVLSNNLIRLWTGRKLLPFSLHPLELSGGVPQHIAEDSALLHIHVGNQSHWSDKASSGHSQARQALTARHRSARPDEAW
eukprot:3570117-Rhodomonas_salina.3